MREDAQHRAAEFIKELYTAGDIGASRLDSGLTGLLAAKTEAELGEVVRSLPAPVPLTSPEPATRRRFRKRRKPAFIVTPVPYST